MITKQLHSVYHQFLKLVSVITSGKNQFHHAQMEALYWVGLLLLYANVLVAQDWPLEILKENIVGAWILPGDFDNDNDQDLLIQSGDTLFWYQNDQPGWHSHIIDTEFKRSEYSAINIADMDMDGDVDVLQASMGNPGELAVNENMLNGEQWQKHVIRSSILQMGNMPKAVGDIDGDNDPDFTLILWNSGRVLWFENDSVWIEHDVGTLDQGVNAWSTLGDLDGDQDLDIIAGQYNSGTIRWFENQLPSSSWQSKTIATLAYTALGECADMDGDGDMDVVTHSNGPQSVLRWYENPSWNGHTVSSNVTGIIVGEVIDVDDDGDPDVTYGGRDLFGWLENQSDPDNWERHTIDTLPGKYPFPTACIDMNGDNYRDLLAYSIDYSKNPSLGDVRIYTNPRATTAIAERAGYLPETYTLAQNIPNPFNPVTSIQFTLSQSEFATLKVYDLQGRERIALVDGYRSAGRHQIQFDGSDLPSGVYVYQLVAGKYIENRKMMLVK